MTHFNPVSVGRAAEIVAEAEVLNGRSLLVHYAAAGLVRAYARLIEVWDVNGTKTDRRDCTISRDQWRRVIDDGAVDQVWDASTVTLGHPGPEGRSAMVMTGIRFHEADVVKAACEHGAGQAGLKTTFRQQPAPPFPAEHYLPCDKAKTPVSLSAGAVPDERTAMNGQRHDRHSAFREEEKADRRSPRPVNPHALTVSVEDAAAMTGLSRQTIYNRIKQGKLESTTSGKRRLVSMASLREMMGLAAKA